MIESSYQLILLFAFLGALCIAIVGVSQRLGAPSLLLFLLVGMLAGEDGLGGIRFDDVHAAFLIGNIALAVILLDGGLRTHTSSFRTGLRPALLLSTLGVAITAGLVGAAAAWILDWPLMNGLLLGAIVGSTDAAAVFGLLGAAGLRLKQRSSSTLEIESGTNDPMAIFLTICLLDLVLNPGTALGTELVQEFFSQLGLGALTGVIGGLALRFLLQQLSLIRALYPLLVVAFGLSVFGLTNLIGGSGFLAIYLIGLQLANRPINYLHDIRWLMDGLAWLGQIAMFLVLGLLITPSSLLDVLVPGLFIAAVLIFAARPLAVILCLLPFRMPWREQAFIGWVGLKGAVPIILAMFPYLSGLEHSNTYFEITFFVVLLSLCLQGWTTASLARALRLDIPPQAEDRRHLGFALPGETGRELLAYEIHAGSPAEAYTLERLPLGSTVETVAVIQRGKTRKPEPELRLEPGDLLLLLTPSHECDALAGLFASLPTPDYLRENAFFGPFVFKGESNIEDVAASYGGEVPARLCGLDLDSAFQRSYRPPVIGDCLSLGAITLVVKQVHAGRVLQVGMRIGD